MEDQAALQVHDPQDQGSREQPLPSHESSNTNVPVGADRAELILSPALYRAYSPNNHYLDVEHDRMHNVLRSILRRHPLNYALTARANVPEVYVQQAWHTMAIIPEHRPPRIQFQVDRFEAFLNYSRLRDALRLPMPDSRPGLTDYVPLPSDSDIFQGILNLGYNRPLTKVKDFSKKHLPPLWHDLFMILNRCLTYKAFGSDSASIQLLRIFHAVAYNLHVDFTFLIWIDLVDRIKEKCSKAKKYLPYMRFLGLFVQSMMQANPQIPPREEFARARDVPMTHFRLQKGVFPNQLDLPVEMILQYARLEDYDIPAHCASRGIQLLAVAAAHASLVRSPDQASPPPHAPSPPPRAPSPSRSGIVVPRSIPIPLFTDHSHPNCSNSHTD